MTTIILCAVIISLIIFMEWRRRQYTKALKAMNKAVQDVLIGDRELEESYEQMYLSQNDQIEMQATALASYVEDHHFLVGLVNDFPELLQPEDLKRFEQIRDHMILLEGTQQG